MGRFYLLLLLFWLTGEAVVASGYSIAAYKSSEGWTYNIHDISRTYPKDEILVHFFQAALHFKTDQPYRLFLKENNLQHFLPADLEQLD